MFLIYFTENEGQLSEEFSEVLQIIVKLNCKSIDDLKSSLVLHQKMLTTSEVSQLYYYLQYNIDFLNKILDFVKSSFLYENGRSYKLFQLYNTTDYEYSIDESLKILFNWMDCHKINRDQFRSHTSAIFLGKASIPTLCLYAQFSNSGKYFIFESLFKIFRYIVYEQELKSLLPLENANMLWLDCNDFSFVTTEILSFLNGKRYFDRIIPSIITSEQCLLQNMLETPSVFHLVGEFSAVFTKELNPKVWQYFWKESEFDYSSNAYFVNDHTPSNLMHSNNMSESIQLAKKNDVDILRTETNKSGTYEVNLEVIKSFLAENGF